MNWSRREKLGKLELDKNGDEDEDSGFSMHLTFEGLST